MDTSSITEKELKLTAAIYAKSPETVAYVKEHGKLPKMEPKPWGAIILRVIIEERGTDITLTPDEQLIYDAIIRENRFPGGSARLVE